MSHSSDHTHAHAQLEIELHPAPGALIRVLAIIERRGWAIVEIESKTSYENLRMSLAIRPVLRLEREASAAIRLLAQQVGRELDVLSVQGSPHR